MGGHIAARLLAGPNDQISVVARGAQLNAIAERGISLQLGDQRYAGRPHSATANSETLAPQDIVIVALKAHSLPGPQPA